ncbi:MAG TPA: type II toxin-antitoxin system Phd/YefM family antitoxin [Rhodanobacteraceae bacterium]|nr:type II toxin-antitoxin system Phd/YefM family antitoxin [Rhodanobacteraceae bacterium]
MRIKLVTTLKRRATALLSEVDRDKEPVLIMQHGLPSAYILDAETYELMEQRMAVLEGIVRGEQALAEGRVASHVRARKCLDRWLK